MYYFFNSMMQKHEGYNSTIEDQKKLAQLELQLVRVSAADITIPSYAVIPISSNIAQNDKDMPYASAESIAEQTVSSTGTVDVLSHSRLDTKLQYISTEDAEDLDRAAELALLTADIALDNFNKHSIDAFNNNDGYDQFKVYDQITESSIQHDNLTDIAGCQDERHELASLSEATHSDSIDRQVRPISMSLEQKIMQDGLQNTIAHISEGTDFANDIKQYKSQSDTNPNDIFIDRSNAENIADDRSTLYNVNCITSHIPDIVSSSNDDHLFESEIDALSFIDDETLENESINAVSHDLCADTITNAQSEAVELAIATEEELPSPWIDVVAMATAPALRTESWPELNAFPTAVHSLVDLIGPEPYPLEIENQLLSTENIENIDAVNTERISVNTEVVHCQKTSDIEHKTGNIKNKKDRNILHEITAAADICKCVDCKCDNVRNCQNCTNNSVAEVTKKDSPLKIVNDFVSSLQNGCSCSAESGGCDSCCVVICLKTLQQLQKVFSRNCCKNASNTICCKEKLLPSIMKCQLAENQ